MLWVVFVCSMVYKSSNEGRHQNTSSLYAHYSQVDVWDLERFPDLAQTSPVHFTLTAGQSLYIPANWWHWVKTTSKSFAVNYWFNNAIAQEPFVFDHTIAFDIDSFNGQTVAVWNSGKDVDYSLQMVIRHFQEFYSSGEDEKYVITLKNYPPGVSNSVLKEIVSKHIDFPAHQNIKLIDEFDFNIWISSGKHDTGLHYDDEDGILTVIEGTKEITLFPPSDSQFLYAYPISYEWRDQVAISCRYNTGQKIKSISGIPSSKLLYVTCNGNKRVLSNISKLYEQHKNSQILVWGFKKEGASYRWEVYDGTLYNPGVRITSWDIYPDKHDISDVVHYYYKEDDDAPPTLPFWGYGKKTTEEGLQSESQLFVVDTYETFLSNYEQYMDKLGFNSIKEKFKPVIFEKYSCYNVCIHNKKTGEIFVQYLGISNEEFIEFLTTHDYPPYIAQFVSYEVQSGNYEINNEITIVYNTTTNEVVRSGFYGNL
jgi:hypothetical protein